MRLMGNGVFMFTGKKAKASSRFGATNLTGFMVHCFYETTLLIVLFVMLL